MPAGTSGDYYETLAIARRELAKPSSSPIRSYSLDLDAIS